MGQVHSLRCESEIRSCRLSETHVCRSSGHVARLLAERFKLALHMEKREYPVFDLVVANQKPKFAESKPSEIHVYQDGSLVCYAIANALDSFKDEGCTMADLIRLLRIYWSSLGRSVVDKTELTGR